jgi:diguanylate cyclase (GGDEF)-like protein/PAS domain S-box-containing protein
VHPDDIGIVEREVAAALAATEPSYSREIEHRFLYATGDTGHMAVRYFILKDAEGRTIRIYGVNQDITERKRVETALRDSQKLVEAILNAIPARVFWKDRNLDFLGCNSAFAHDAGAADPAEIVGKNDYQLGWRTEADAYRADDKEVIESGRGKLLIEESQTTTRGDTITLLTSKIPLRNSSGEIAGVLGMYLDITDRKRAEEALRESEKNFRTIFTSVTEGIFLADPATGRFLDANPAGCAIFGYSHEEILGCDIGMLSSGIPPYTPEGARDINARLVEEGPHTFQWNAKARDGHLLWVEISTRRAELGGRQLVLAAVRDITDRKEAETIILQMARYDALTGLANRRVFVEEVERTIARARRTDKGLAVLYLDLDHFKDVNDTLGHPVGDELLKAVAERLRANMREVDMAARFGGDEFAVVMSDLADPADAAVLAEKLLKCLSEPFHLGGNEIRSGTSIGIAIYGNDTPDAETILTHADLALYRAKNEGRGTFRFFTDAMDREVKTRVTLAAELREAIAAEQFTLYYQPEVDIDTGQIIGLEALVRWNHPRQGLLGPGEFIPAAEKCGLIVTLGRWILREACRQARKWIDLGIAPGFVAVNLSILQFKSTQDLEADIAAAQAEFALPPRMLELELTETVLMDATRRNSDILQRLRHRGVRIAIDDFGTGYSSLDYLRRLPVDRIKIAQAFVTDLVSNPSSASIVRAALGLARELGLGVIAEGVETKEQLELLRSWGCREAQGFYFSKPRPPQEITELRVGLQR